MKLLFLSVLYLPVLDNHNTTKKTKTGALVQEIHQVYNDWLAQVIRLYKGQDHIELDWVVGSIPIE